MTCKDCIYFNPTEHLKPEWVGSNRCDKHTADGYQEYVGKDTEICADFTSKDGTFHNKIDHCPKCGKPVDKWGLCDECENVYLTHESVGNALDALDSWESISK